MDAYSMDLRQRVVRACDEKVGSQRRIAELFGVSLSLFEQFDTFLNEQGYAACKGSLIDARIVEVPRQRNSREEDKQIKAGQRPSPRRSMKSPRKAARKTPTRDGRSSGNRTISATRITSTPTPSTS